MFRTISRKLSIVRRIDQEAFRPLILLVALWMFMGLVAACAPVQQAATEPTTPPSTEVSPTEIPSEPFNSWVTGEITNPALEGNLIGDPATRNYIVYLPPSYATGDKRYPVLYILHNWLRDENDPVTALMNTKLFGTGDLEMIIIFPNAANTFNGSTYGNSPTTGDYETYIVRDLVNHVDTNFRTLPQRDSRGIAGWGMGASGAMSFALMHPDIFGLVASMSTVYDMENLPSWEWARERFRGVPADFNEFANLNGQIQLMMALAADNAPNPDNPPFYLDMPLAMQDGHGQIVSEVAEKINGSSLIYQLSPYLEQPVRLNGILIYHGNDAQNPLPIADARAFDHLLSQQGIDHKYLELEGGDHQLPYDPVLEFMMEHLSFEMP